MIESITKRYGKGCKGVLHFGLRFDADKINFKHPYNTPNDTPNDTRIIVFVRDKKGGFVSVKAFDPDNTTDYLFNTANIESDFALCNAFRKGEKCVDVCALIDKNDNLY